MDKRHMTVAEKEFFKAMVDYGGNCTSHGIIIGAVTACIGVIIGCGCELFWDYRDDIMSELKAHIKK